MARRSHAYGYTPVAEPYDVAAFVLLYRARTSPNLPLILPAIGFRREIVLALAETLGVEVEPQQEDANDAV